MCFQFQPDMPPIESDRVQTWYFISAVIGSENSKVTTSSRDEDSTPKKTISGQEDVVLVREVKLDPSSDTAATLHLPDRM